MFTNLENLKNAIESNDKKEAKKVLATMCRDNEYKLARRFLELTVEGINENVKKALLAIDLLELIESMDAREDLMIKTFYPCHRMEGVDSWKVFLVFSRNESKETIDYITNYYGMDESYYMGAGYGFGEKPEVVEKGSRILVKQYRGLDI